MILGCSGVLGGGWVGLGWWGGGMGGGMGGKEELTSDGRRVLEGFELLKLDEEGKGGKVREKGCRREMGRQEKKK